MQKKRSAYLSPKVLFLTILLLIILTTVLFWLRQEYIREHQRAIDLVRSAFDNQMLGEPFSASGIKFHRLEIFAREMQELTPQIKQIFITKYITPDKEQILQPFWLKNLPRKKLTVIPLLKNDKKIGNLYLALSNIKIYLLNALIVALLLFTIITLASLLMRIFQQQKTILRTRVELEEKQEQLLQLERMALVGRLTASLLHDLRKPVLTIREEIQYLTDKEIRQRIEEQVDFFLAMVHEVGIENFLRPDSQEEYIDLKEVIHRVLALVQYAGDGIQIKTDIPASIPLFIAPKLQLIQVLSNLTLNAFEAMDGKGELCIISWTKNIDAHQYLEIQIKDNGPGLPEEVQKNIFLPFFSYNKTAENSGLGLYICKSIIEQLGGKIDFNSKPGETSFFISIPLRTENEKNQAFCPDISPKKVSSVRKKYFSKNPLPLGGS